MARTGRPPHLTKGKMTAAERKRFSRLPAEEKASALREGRLPGLKKGGRPKTVTLLAQDLRKSVRTAYRRAKKRRPLTSVIRIGDCVIDTGGITTKELVGMRDFLTRGEYQRVKNLHRATAQMKSERNEAPKQSKKK